MRAVIRIAIAATAVVATLAACTGSNEGSEAPERAWTRIGADQLDAMMQQGDVDLINVHVPNEGEIPGTDALVPYDEIDEVARLIEQAEGDVVLYCRSGTMSSQTAQALVDRGVTDFAELDGGYQAWQAAGLPFEIP